MNKEQKEAIALTFILTAVVISACMMLIVKPKLGRVADVKKSIRKVNEDVLKQRKYSRKLLELATEKEMLEKSIADSESGLLGGIMVGDLSKIVNTITRDNFKNLKVNYLGDTAEVLPGERYSELSNKFTVQGANFYDVVRFINALETANPGIRVTNVEIESRAVRPEMLGRVTAGIDVKFVGMFEGPGLESEWTPESEVAYNSDGLRNPFGPIGGEIGVDPEQAFKDVAYNLKVTINTGESLWINNTADESRGARECLRGRLMPVFEPQKVRLLRIGENYFIVRREEDRKAFKLTVRDSIERINDVELDRGTIARVDELKPES